MYGWAGAGWWPAGPARRSIFLRCGRRSRALPAAWRDEPFVGHLAARCYEPLLGRMLAGVRLAARRLAPARPGMVVLDVGCGTGAFLSTYAAAGCRVIGVDLSTAMLTEARRRLGPGALLVQGEACALPFPSDGADLVTAVMVLHALARDEARGSLAEMGRVAGARGRVLVADHAAGRRAGLGARALGAVAMAVETLAGHGPGVRRLVAAGGVPSLAARAGLEVEAVVPAADGVLEVLCLRPIGPVS
jgi:SAM-dependent methyltransferase